VNVASSTSPISRALRIPPATAFFAAAALLLWGATRGAIPALVRAGLDPLLAWFVAGGLGVFAPMLAAAAWVVRAEGVALDREAWRERLRFRRLSRADLRLGLLGLVVIAVWTGGVTLLFGEHALHPPFLNRDIAVLGPGRRWLLAAWLPFWLLNIGGEEILWRGVLLPRQEAGHGGRAWLVHAAGWAVFHVSFGATLILALAPTLLLLPWVVQRTRNSTVGVLLHAGLNGPGFMAVALGLV
jgi:membrane protease YdiL (CAAX protease family)